MCAEELDDIWLFVEQKWKLHIPTYFKNVLKVCGYNNGITIASIEDEDVQYIESEVKNGNVTKYFCNVDEENVLKDCTMSAKNFAFTMGHRKWLMTIVDFLKKHLDENGPDSFTIEDALKKLPSKNIKKKPPQTNHLVASKSSSKIPNVSNTQIRQRNYLLENPNENQNEIPIADLKIQKGILICNAIMSLINIIPTMYAKHMDTINKKISSNLVRIEMKNNPVNQTQKESVELSVVEFKTALVIEAIICCPLCSKPITVSNKSTEINQFIWNTTNFDWHLKNVHLKQTVKTNNNVEEDKIPRKTAVKEPSNKIKNRELNGTATLEAKALMLEKSMNQDGNIETSIVENEIPDKRAVKKPLKKVNSLQNLTMKSEAKTPMAKAIISDYMEANSLKLNSSIKTIFKSPMEMISPVEISKSKGAFIQTQTGCRKTLNERPYQELRTSSLVCYSDTSIEDEGQQQEQIHSEIVTGGHFELNEEFRSSQDILKSKSVANNTYFATDLQEVIIPESGQYVICSLSVKSCLQWPAATPIVKNFVGQVSLIKECEGNRDLENVEIKLLKKNPHSNRIFHFPEDMALSQVPRKKIVKTLQDPIKNRRGDYVFQDKSILDYVF